MCKKKEIDESFKWVNNNVGQIGILVNCAGVLVRTTLLGWFGFIFVSGVLSFGNC